MARKSRPHPILEHVLQPVSLRRKGIARVNDKVVFVPHVILGDIVDL